MTTDAQPEAPTQANPPPSFAYGQYCPQCGFNLTSSGVLEHQTISLQSQINRLEGEKAEQRNNYAILYQMWNDLKKTSDAQTAEIVEHKRQIAELTQHNAKWKAYSDSQIAQLEQKTKAFNTSTTLNTTIQKDLQVAQERSQDFEKRWDECQQRCSTKEEELVATQAELAASKTNNEKLQKDLDAATEELGTVLSGHNPMGLLRTSITQLQATLQNTMDHEFHNQLVETNQRVVDGRVQLDEKVQQVRTLEQDLTESRAEAVKLTGQLQEATGKVERKREKIRYLEERLDTVTGRFSRTQREIDEQRICDGHYLE